MADEVLLGLDAKLNFKVGGQSGAGSWTEMTNAKDVKLSLTKGEADATTRATNGWRANTGTLKEGELTWDMNWKPSDAGFAAVKNAYLTRNAIIGLQCLDKDSGEGLQADWSITGFEINQGLEEVISVSVTAKIAPSDTAPDWIGD